MSGARHLDYHKALRVTLMITKPSQLGPMIFFVSRTAQMIARPSLSTSGGCTMTVVERARAAVLVGGRAKHVFN